MLLAYPKTPDFREKDLSAFRFRLCTLKHCLYAHLITFISPLSETQVISDTGYVRIRTTIFYDLHFQISLAN